MDFLMMSRSLVSMNERRPNNFEVSPQDYTPRDREVCAACADLLEIYTLKERLVDLTAAYQEVCRVLDALTDSRFDLSDNQRRLVAYYLQAVVSDKL